MATFGDFDLAHLSYIGMNILFKDSICCWVEIALLHLRGAEFEMDVECICEIRGVPYIRVRVFETKTKPHSEGFGQEEAVLSICDLQHALVQATHVLEDLG